MLKKVSIKRQGQIQSFLSTTKDNEDLQVWNEENVTMVRLWGISVTNSVLFIPLLYNLFFIHLGENEGGKKKERQERTDLKGTGPREETQGDSGQLFDKYKEEFLFPLQLPTASGEASLFPQNRSRAETCTCAVPFVITAKSMVF